MKKNLKRREFLKTLRDVALSTAAVSVLPQSAWSVGEDEYEFIVIGSGAGGGPLAVNLAKHFKVLLIEAGGNELPVSAQIPALHVLASEDPHISWDFFVKHHNNPDQHGKWNTEKGGILYPRSSIVGGCTAHNAMICLYPDHDDWDRIFKLTGAQDSSWNSQYMQQIFRNKIENGHYFADKTRGWHHLEMSPISLLKGNSSLKKIVLSAANSRLGLLDEILKATENRIEDTFKIDSYLDANKPWHIGDQGFLRIPKSTYKGKRYGVFEYVNETAKKNKNLTIVPHTLVKEILFERVDGELKATGVVALKGKNIYRAHKLSGEAEVREEIVYKAQKEVILCGGAFNSPQTLMLSGIGPADQYDSETSGAPLKMRPKMILEGVGRNLQDRYEVTVVTELNEDIELLKNCEFSTDVERPDDQCLQDWLDEKTREKSVYASNGVLAAIKLKSSVCQKNKTDLILFGAPGDFRGYYSGYSKDALAHKDRFTWAVLKGHSRNRQGRITLKDGDCLNTPEIHFHYFEGSGAEDDLQAVYEGLKQVRSINCSSFGVHGGSRTYQRGISRPGKGELYPGTSLSTEKDLKSWIEREAWGHHASCTNKMGINPKDGSVVNGEFKVHGTKNLRIVDASVFPEIPGLFIVTPIYMISEKASEVIIKKYKG